MDRLVSGVAFVELERAQIIERVVQLRVKVLPFAHPQIGEKALLAEFPPLALRPQPFPLVVDGVPDVEQREKVGLRIGEPFVGGGGGFLLVERTLARVLDAQAGGDDQQFPRGVFVLRLEQHAAERGINRQPREVVAERRELALFIQRAEFLEQRVAAGDGGGRGRMDKRKRLDVAEAERLHAQDDFGEIGALDFRLRERRARLEILLRVEPDADAVLHAPRAAFALVGAALRDRLDRQALGARARVVTADAREAGINHIADAGNGQRGFGDVRGDDDLAAGGGREDALLIARTEPAEQRDDLRFAGEAAFEQVAGLADVAFARHEDQHVAAVGFVKNAFRRLHRGVHVADVAPLFGRRVQRLIANFHRIQPAGDFDDRRVVEVPRKGLRVNRGRGDDQLQILAPGQQALQVAEQEINVQAALVRFVEDDRVVFRQVGSPWVSASRMPSVISLM